MEKLRIYYDRAGGTLTVWFGDSKEEYTSEETDDEIILMKNKDGRVIRNSGPPTGKEDQ